MAGRAWLQGLGARKEPTEEKGLRRTLGTPTLVALGIGAIIGAGLFSLTGIAAAENAGPAVTISFVLAALGCAFAGLCYSELAGMIPSAGSAYAYAYASMGELYVQKDNLTEAVTSLEKARELQPNSVPLLNFLAETEARAGRAKQAQDVYRAVLAIDPNNPQALNNLAFAIADSGTNLDEALTMASKAKQQLPNVDQVSDTLGWIYIKKNMGDSAADVFSTLTRKAPENPTYHYHYCMALYEKGDKAGAQRECNAALAKNPVKNQAEQVRQLMAKLQ